MTLNEYQEQAMTTCLPSSKNFSYMMLNLVGEVGEFASKVAKHIRKGEAGITEQINMESGEIENNHLEFFPVETMPGQDIADWEQKLQKEAGDILWQLSGLCSVMGWKLEDIAQQNLDKLASRQQRNVIDGNGDNR